MNAKFSTFFVLLTLLVGPINGSAQQPRYRLIDLGTFGGPQSYVNVPLSYAKVLNNNGTAVGWADTSLSDPFPDFCFDEDCFLAHAFRTQNNVAIDLGALPGGGSSQASWISSSGLISGISQNGEIDPLFPPFPELRAVLWTAHGIADLGTLEGGYESAASAVNSRGQVVGFATNTIPDADSMVGTGFQTRAFLWQNGFMRDLGTLGGTDATAWLINERGQVAGVSYLNSEPSEACASAEVGTLTTGAFLWTNGTMKDLGNLGGTCTFASDMNNRGQVVGGSFLPGDQASHPFLWNGAQMIDLGTFGGDFGNAIAMNDGGDAVGWATYPGDEVIHAVLWRSGRMVDLGTVPGDTSSFAWDVNARGQVVGTSVPPGGDLDSGHAFVWQHGGPMLDLNTLVPPGSSLYLTEPETINDRGEIAGEGFDADGNQHAFLLVPCGANDGSCQNVPAAPTLTRFPAITKPANKNSSFRRMPRRRLLPINNFRVANTPADASAKGSNIAATSLGPAATEGSPSWLDSQDAGIGFSIAPSCILYGRQCNPQLHQCCGTLHCRFSGGSTRVGYQCR